MTESVSRTATLYSTRKRKGRLGVSKTTFFERFVLHDVSDPYLPGTTVRRLRLLRLAPKATAVFDREVDELIEGLRKWRDAGCAVRAKPVGKGEAVQAAT
jgi:hypothetical protein